MLKKLVKYTDYNDNARTQEFFFYLSKKDIQFLNARYQEDGGLGGRFNKIMNKLDMRMLLETVEDIVLTSYGVKSEDGERFIKNDKAKEDFKYSAAYEALFDELTTGDDSADKFSSFLKKILPNEIQAEITKAEAEGKVEMPEILAEAIKDQEAANKVTDITK